MPSRDYKVRSPCSTTSSALWIANDMRSLGLSSFCRLYHLWFAFARTILRPLCAEMHRTRWKMVPLPYLSTAFHRQCCVHPRITTYTLVCVTNRRHCIICRLPLASSSSVASVSSGSSAQIFVRCNLCVCSCGMMPLLSASVVPEWVVARLLVDHTHARHGRRKLRWARIMLAFLAVVCLASPQLQRRSLFLQYLRLHASWQICWSFSAIITASFHDSVATTRKLIFAAGDVNIRLNGKTRGLIDVSWSTDPYC